MSTNSVDDGKRRESPKAEKPAKPVANEVGHEVSAESQVSPANVSQGELKSDNGKKKKLELKTVLTSEKMLEQFQKALPSHLSAERFVRVCVTALTRTPMLLECTQESFFKCVLDLSAMGLEPDGVRAHLIPFRNKREGTVECTLLIDYKGLVELVRRSGDVVRIHADVVCPDDVFEFSMGQVLHHTWDLSRPRTSPIAAYALVVFKGGESQAVILQKHEIDAVRSRSKSKDDGPWVSDYNEMAKKTAFRRLCKWLTLSPELAQHISDDDESQFGHQYRQQNATAGLLGNRVVPIDPFKKGVSHEGD